MSSKTFYPVEEMFAEAGKFVSEYDKVLSDLGFVQGIDEIAIQFDDARYAHTFVAEAVTQEGCVLFNTATDHVHTQPLNTCYDVAYLFLSLPGQYHPENRSGVRLECMFLGDGLSPLHAAEAEEMRKGSAKSVTVHASFKVEDEEDYASAVHRLREGGWEVAQKCDSKYGRFSYWKHADLADGVYLKPRVNLRDGIPSR